LLVCIALAYHNAQLQASAFREEFDPDSFEDLTEPNIGKIHKVNAVQIYLQYTDPHTFSFQRAGSLMKEWKLALLNDDTANVVVPITGSKRKAVRCRVL
jgi:ATP-dependent DNA helicase 2 subunit 1